MVSIPVAIGLSLCDYVTVEDGTKKVSLIGAFEKLELIQADPDSGAFGSLFGVRDLTGRAGKGYNSFDNNPARHR